MKGAIIALALFAGSVSAQDCPMHAGHAGHSKQSAKPSKDEIDRQGDVHMGFSQERSRHRFVLTDDGGSIEVVAKSSEDAETISLIRAHLALISKRFAAGDFYKPERIHGRVPDGVEVMVERRNEIIYTYSEIKDGGRVSITSTAPEVIEAIRSFLRFQISDHETEAVDSSHASHSSHR